MIKKLVKFMNKPLPDMVCMVFQRDTPCKICWECVTILVVAFLVVWAVS